ncbi:MAG TPA: DUF6286 domain-containing protein [Jiangellaceae bacterium]
MSATTQPRPPTQTLAPQQRAVSVAAHRADLRRSRRVPAVLVAAGLLTIGAVTAVEAVLVAAGLAPLLVPRDRLADQATGVDWDDPGLLTVAAIAAAVGLLLLALAVLPGRRRLLVIRAADPGVLVTVGPRALRRLLATDATGITGVHRARVALRGRHTTLRIRGRGGVNPGARTQAAQAVRDRLEQLHPAYATRTGRPLQPHVRTRWRETRR